MRTNWLRALLAGITTVALAAIAINTIGIGDLPLVPFLPVILGAIAAQWFLSGNEGPKWGGTACRRCNTPQVRLQIERTMRGTVTCRVCKAQIDKSGCAE